jgi:hypothetical protein
MNDAWQPVARHGDSPEQVRAALLVAHGELLAQSQAEWLARLLSDPEMSVPEAMRLVGMMAAHADRIAREHIERDLEAIMYNLALAAGRYLSVVQ